MYFGESSRKVNKKEVTRQEVQMVLNKFKKDTSGKTMVPSSFLTFVFGSGAFIFIPWPFDHRLSWMLPLCKTLVRIA